MRRRGARERSRGKKGQKEMGRQKRTRRRRESEHCLNIDRGVCKWSGDKEMEGINEGDFKTKRKGWS